MGIAVNTGEVVVGNIGSETRSKYGVVGHHVNLTARIESFTVGGQIMASEFTVNALQPEITIAQSLQVEAKGIKEAVTIHEITAIGAPYDLRLEDKTQILSSLKRELPVSFSRVTGKAIADECEEGTLTAANAGVAKLSTNAELQVMNNLRMNIPGYPGSENDQIYSKVTSRVERQNGQNQYIIKLTSAPLEARKYIRNLML